MILKLKLTAEMQSRLEQLCRAIDQRIENWIDGRLDAVVGECRYGEQGRCRR